MAEIIIDFLVDEVQLSEDLQEKSDPGKVDSDLILLTYFIMPVRININGKEFFAFKSINETDPWIGMPIVNIAIEGICAIKGLNESKTIEYCLPEAVGIIQFTLLDNNKVRVVYRKNDIDEIVNYNDLYRAFLDFGEKVKKFLKERVPQMREHPRWGSWVQGEVE